MDSIIFRAQLSSDKITSVSEEWSDSYGAYQIAFGFDGEGKEIVLCNNGFTQWPNYIRNVKTTSEIKSDKIKSLITKRESQIVDWSAVNTLQSRCMVRSIKQRLAGLQKKLESYKA